MASGTGASNSGGSHSVQVIGLRSLQKQLAKIGPELPKELAKENLRIAENIAAKSRRKMASLGPQGAKAAPAISARSQQRYATIRLDGSKRGKTAFALGVEFGGLRRTMGQRIPVNSRGPSKIRGGFQPWRGNQWRPSEHGVGYAIHPTIRDNYNWIMQQYEDMVGRLAHRAFPD